VPARIKLPSAGPIDLPQLISAAGSVCLPGSKSISNRVLLLAALAEGRTELHNLLASDDTARMREALETLGVRIDSLADGGLCVHGVAGDFPNRQAELFLGNAGTAFRTLTATLALAGGRHVLKGVPRMHERPIGDLVDALRQLGARIDYLEREGFPPLSIAPAHIRPGGVVRIRGDVSSQFLSGLLLALPLTGVETTVCVEGALISKPYVDITLDLMARFGVTVARQGWQVFTLPAGARYRTPKTFSVEGDASSASYFLALGAIGATPEAPVRVVGVGRASIQGDVRFAEALQEMGARIELGDTWMQTCAPAEGLRGITLDCNHIPDAAMTLAVTALFAKGKTTLTNIASWRVKETDRIAAMARELQKLGARVEAGTDALSITPPETPLTPAIIDTYDDHRMAMCFSLAAFGAPVRINDPDCTAKTFPAYFAQFLRLVRPVPVIAIDGPTASGKGAVGARVAGALGFHMLDSGLLYRLTAFAAQTAGVDWDDEPGLARIAAGLDVRFEGERVFLAEREVSALLRAESISAKASRVAALPAVREALLFRQRAFRRAPGLVGDGRDMGSVVFPDATLKVFLTASAEVRAARRHEQLSKRGQSAERATILADLEARDQRDKTRAVAPLRQEKDAYWLDTDHRDIEAATRQILAWYEMFEIVEKESPDTVIKVVGVGGAGGNAIDHMIREKVKGVEFIVANTDSQALGRSIATSKLTLGKLGAGGKPEVGRAAAEAHRDEIQAQLSGADMVFITAGMGGGTGTGAAPVVAEIAQEMGILTVGVVFKPFSSEGPQRIKNAEAGIAEFVEKVDSLIVILNDKLVEVIGKKAVRMDELFHAADDVLKNAVGSIVEIITNRGLINVDFEDIRTVMSETGLAIIGSAVASGGDRARIATEQAVVSPLLGGVNLSDAKRVLVNITASRATLDLEDLHEIISVVSGSASGNAKIIFGATYDDTMEDRLRVTVIATGLGQVRQFEMVRNLRA
jgi:3-phosphoshikimate 1-carboxyvinyltransferase